MPNIQNASREFHLYFCDGSNVSLIGSVKVIDQIVSRFLQGVCPLSADRSQNPLEASNVGLSILAPFHLNDYNGSNLSNSDTTDPVAPLSLMGDSSSAFVQEPGDADLKLDSEERLFMYNLLPFPSFIEECLSLEEKKICDEIYDNR